MGGLRSKVTRGIDMARFSNAVSRPGIDPRIWVSYAVLTSEPYIETVDGRQDVVVDLTLMPSLQEETARVGSIYAGNGFGFYAPMHKDDEVLVVAPSGDPDAGLVVIQRMWSPADPPPPEINASPEDVTLVVEEGKNLHLMTMGGGTIYLDALDGGSLTVNVGGTGNVNLNVDQGKIYLGAEAGTEPAAKATSLKTYLDSLQAAIASHSHIVTGTGTITPPSTAVPFAGTAAPSITVFPSPPATILSDKVEVK